MNQWYQKFRIEVEPMFGSDFGLFCDILAATSPRRHVKANWILANRVYKSYKCGYIDTTGLMKPHTTNVFRAVNRQPLSGMKVFAFSENLKGNLIPVTVDIWIAKSYGIERLTPKRYRDIESDIKDKASKIGVFPAEYQAQLWEDTMRQHGRRPVSYLCYIDKQLSFWEN